MTYDPEHWPPYNIDIKVDGNNQPIVRYVIHELLHVIFSPLITGTVDETLEEVFILALDGYMYDYVKLSKSRLAKWDALIEQKLGSEPDRPLEELADRT